MTQNPNMTDPPSQGGQVSQPPAQGATSPSQGDQSSTTGQHRSVEELEQLLAEFKRDNANYRKKAREQEEAAQAAEQERLKQQGEFKALAEKHEARVKELEPISESYTRLASTMNAQIEAEIKDWPPEVKSLVPPQETVLSNGERRVTPVEERLEHITRLRPLLEKLQVQARGTQPGNSPNPRPQAQTAEGAGKEYMQRLLDTGKYGRA